MDQHIIYREIAPYKALSPYIDAFWTVTGANTADQPDRILPDGCVDIILNNGPSFITEQGTTRLNNGEAYLVGTMTRYKEMVRPPGTRLIGIRFKPGGFSCFYDPALLRSTADRTVLFDPSLFPLPADHSLSPPPDRITNTADRSLSPSPDRITNTADRSLSPSPDHITSTALLLNRFFLDRLNPSSRDLLPLLNDIGHQQGRVTVHRLARQHFLTIRQLERLFERHLALGPKEFINFTRFQSALAAIRHRRGKTLLDIACEHGYYDHAHLSNAIRKYTGSAPTAL